MSHRKENVSLLFKNDVCAFCGIGEDNKLLYGKYIKSDEICIHSNCMYFASGIYQHEENQDSRYAGFLLPDIKAELLRGKKLKCAYCHERGATVGCCNLKCKKTFHLPCGIRHNSLHQFYGTFRSFCNDHSPKQKNIDAIKDKTCHICFEEISNKELNTCLYSPCCKNSWFHKLCLQKYAENAGLYYFKCPLCNNSKKFIKSMKDYGICIPDKDASWELEDNAYQELLRRPECDATICLCPEGRTFAVENNSGWSLLCCSDCGSRARHISCENVMLSADCWICEECKLLEQKISAKTMPVLEDVRFLSYNSASAETMPVLEKAHVVNNILEAQPSSFMYDRS